MSSCPTRNFCLLEIGLPYLAQRWFITRGYVAYIHDPNTMLTFDFKVIFIGFMTWLCVWTTAFLSSDKVIFYVACEFITMIQCVAYIYYLCMTLTFYLNIKIFIMNLTLVRSSLFFDIKGYQIWAYGCITLRQHVYILDLCMTLTFDLCVGHTHPSKVYDHLYTFLSESIFLQWSVLQCW